MSDDNLSIKFTEETKKSIYKNEISYTSEKYLLIAFTVNVISYLITYFSPKIFSPDGETSLYFLGFLGLIGFVIGHEAIKLSKKFSIKKAEKGETNIEPGVMSGYKYISYQDQEWIKWLVAVACGGLNVFAYLLFLKII